LDDFWLKNQTIAAQLFGKKNSAPQNQHELTGIRGLKNQKPQEQHSLGFKNLIFLMGQQYPQYRFGLKCECYLIIYNASSTYNLPYVPSPRVDDVLVAAVPDVPIPVDFIFI
jgi:hypothetical protein